VDPGTCTTATTTATCAATEGTRYFTALADRRPFPLAVQAFFAVDARVEFVQRALAAKGGMAFFAGANPEVAAYANVKPPCAARVQRPPCPEQVSIPHESSGASIQSIHGVGPGSLGCACHVNLCAYVSRRCVVRSGLPDNTTRPLN
jgi:hypothetical protein